MTRICVDIVATAFVKSHGIAFSTYKADKGLSGVPCAHVCPLNMLELCHSPGRLALAALWPVVGDARDDLSFAGCHALTVCVKIKKGS